MSNLQDEQPKIKKNVPQNLKKWFRMNQLKKYWKKHEEKRKQKEYEENMKVLNSI